MRVSDEPAHGESAVVCTSTGSAPTSTPLEHVRVSEPDCSVQPTATRYVQDEPDAMEVPTASHPLFVPAGATGMTHDETVLVVQVDCVTFHTPLTQKANPPDARV
jgi:hypothetical protein